MRLMSMEYPKINMPAEAQVAQVMATLAIEDMYINERTKQDLLLIIKGEKSADELIEKWIEENVRQ